MQYVSKYLEQTFKAMTEIQAVSGEQTLKRFSVKTLRFHKNTSVQHFRSISETIFGNNFWCSNF